MPANNYVSVVGLSAGWFASSITIIFVNKYLLSFADFRFPFLMTLVNNFNVSIIAALLSVATPLRVGVREWSSTVTDWRRLVSLSDPPLQAGAWQR